MQEGTGAGRRDGWAVDAAAVFGALPTPYLVMTSDLVIVDANRAYLDRVGRTHEQIVGRPVFEAFPPTPDALDESGVPRVQLSLEKVIASGQPDTMPLQKYDIPDPGGDGMTERFWSLIHVPVLDEQGRTVLLVQRAEDVTDYVRERERVRSAQARGEELGRRVEQVEADLYARGLELQAAVLERETTSRRLGALAEVALQINSTQSVEDLTSVVIERGMAALGADGGAVAVTSGDELRLAITASIRERTQAFATLPLDGPLPSSVVARTGQRVLLPDAAALLSWHPRMQEVLDSTGCQAWACLPLQVGGRRLGALSVGWVEARVFADSELEILDAMAAQCAQALERIQERQAERRSASRARRMSETLQRSLLTEPPQQDHLQIAVRYRPAAQEAQVGGDWYDAFLTPDGATCLVIGDVAGHDRDAAAAMGQLRNLLRGVAHALRKPPAAVLTALDEAVRDLAVGSLATAVLARIEAGSPPLRTLRWSNAGHLPPLLIGPDGSALLLRTDADLLLGLDPHTPRTDHVLDLGPGSTLLLYTDGLVERRDASIDDGLERLLEVAQELAGLELEELCDALLQRLGSVGDDDIALLALRAHPDD